MYFQPSTGQEFSGHSQVRSAMPWVLFGDSISDQDLVCAGIFPVVSESPPLESGQVAVRAGVEQIDGHWTQLWTVREMNEAELAAAAAAIERLRDEKRAQIDHWRAEANASTFPHGGKQIACDALSRSDIDGVANHIALFGDFPEGWPGGWKATDKTMLPLADVDAFRTMYASMTAEGTSNFNHSQNLKAELALAKTQDEIAAIQW